MYFLSIFIYFYLFYVIWISTKRTIHVFLIPICIIYIICIIRIIYIICIIRIRVKNRIIFPTLSAF